MRSPYLQGLSNTTIAQLSLDSELLKVYLEESLERLQTNYVDVYFIHSPNPDRTVAMEAHAFKAVCFWAL
jgi:aryl-alcohol dehydrogenase-like predicted oxidoreductase